MNERKIIQLIIKQPNNILPQIKTIQKNDSKSILIYQDIVRIYFLKNNVAARTKNIITTSPLRNVRGFLYTSHLKNIEQTITGLNTLLWYNK